MIILSARKHIFKIEKKKNTFEILLGKLVTASNGLDYMRFQQFKSITIG